MGEATRWLQPADRRSRRLCLIPFAVWPQTKRCVEVFFTSEVVAMRARCVCVCVLASLELRQINKWQTSQGCTCYLHSTSCFDGSLPKQSIHCPTHMLHSHFTAQHNCLSAALQPPGYQVPQHSQLSMAHKHCEPRVALRLALRHPHARDRCHCCPGTS